MNKTFNLKAALSGAKVVLDNKPVTIAGYNPDAPINYSVLFWDSDGRGRVASDAGRVGTTGLLEMAPIEKKEWIVRMVHIKQKHIRYCSGPQSSLEMAEMFVKLNSEYFDCTIHEITIVE